MSTTTSSTLPHANTTMTTARLLYRGALSLPDSYLLLDGLTFIATSPSTMLLENPLALALESMRGRPSLRFLGTTKLKDVWLDASGDVTMNIHLHAVLSRIYFENTFCFAPICDPDGRSEHGVRVALGDSDGPETTEILIYAQRLSSLADVVSLLGPTQPSHCDFPNSSPSPIALQVARITRFPPASTPTPQRPDGHSSQPRPPRPDDPTPRKVPLVPFGLGPGVSAINKRTQNQMAQGPNGFKRAKKNIVEEGETVRRAMEVMLKMPRPATSGVFKVPPLPSRKGKGKEKIFDDPFQADAVVTEIEQANKLSIKKSAVHSLASHGIPRDHKEFRDIFAHVYRGTTFALRSKIQSTSLDARQIDMIVDMHVKMYVGGGESVDNIGHA